MILAAVCLTVSGMIAFCAGLIRNAKGRELNLRIGYTAADNMLTELAVSYVQDMESIQSLCTLEAVGEQEGKKLLEEGALSALIVLPEDVVDEILSGRNAPAKLYLPGRDENALSGGGLEAVSGMLFEELASAGMGMLQTAQAEIYASSSVLQELMAGNEDRVNSAVIDSSFLQSMYDDINRFNLGVVTSREKLFQIKSLSLTENDTYAVYYGSALFTVYAMLAGLFFGEFCKRSNFWQNMTDKRIGIGYAAQLADRCLAGSLLMFVVTALPMVLFAIPQVRTLLSLECTLAGGVSLILISFFLIVYNMMIYQIVEKRESAIVVSGILVLIQAYMSGCLIPSVLLPKAVAKVGELLPASFMKKGFTLLFTGGSDALSYMATGLIIWGMVLFLLTIVCMYTEERDGAAARIRRKRFPAGRHVPSVGMVLFRRVLRKKSIWLFVGGFAVLSVGIVRVEKNSAVQIEAAVYDASGNYQELLESYEGLIRFTMYENREQVMDAVQRGSAECGYVLPRNLGENMASRRANQSITVYQDEDAVAVPVISEVIFERIFRQVSLEWYADYVLQNDVIREYGISQTALKKKVQDCFDRELSAGTTFRFEIERMGIDNAFGKEEGRDKVVYPVFMAFVIVAVLCALQGCTQAMADTRNHSFYKRNRAAMSALTIVLPVLIGGIGMSVAVVLLFFL
ncbi:MAG: ABC transporter permease [Lachnospiraceae bacterium]|nr:ABC transporter permease [Lachnospiraceae bacterium]